MNQQPKILIVALLISLAFTSLSSAACVRNAQAPESATAVSVPPTATDQPALATETATSTAQPPPVTATAALATPVEMIAPTSQPTASSAAVKLIVEPLTAPATEPVTIRVENLQPEQQIVLTSRASDWRGHEWEASGVWVADENGVVDLTQHAPEEGSYGGVDGMGLFWSMLPVIEVENPSFFNNGNSYLVEISAEINQQPIASINVLRENISANVLRRDLNENGLRGVFYYPATDGPHPALLLLGGSEGGFSRWGAANWATQGYATLSLAYFGVSPMPNQLSEIPLETFSQGLEWLQAQPEVDPERLAISGASRGSEAALLTAINHPEISAVIVIAPSSLMWSGLDFSGGSPKSAWTYEGQPLPFNPMVNNSELSAAAVNPPVAFTPQFEASIVNILPEAVIPAEQIAAPILMISGTQDELWPSTTFANQIEARLQSNSFSYPVENLVIVDGGHFMRIDHMPPVYASASLIFGGTREANASGGVESWQAQVEFLNAHLGER